MKRIMYDYEYTYNVIIGKRDSFNISLTNEDIEIKPNMSICLWRGILEYTIHTQIQSQTVKWHLLTCDTSMERK